MSSTQITINLFGLSCRVYLFAFDDIQLQKLNQFALKNKTTVEEAILDPEFPEYLFDGHKASLSDFSKRIVSGLIEDHGSIAEIKLNGFKKRKIMYSDILYSNLLFPLYRVISDEIKTSTDFNFMVIKKEIGLMASYSFQSPKRFDLEHLTFGICNLRIQDFHVQALENIYYQDIPLKSVRSDTLVRGGFGMALNI
jgi:hypothetical protein